MKSGARRGARHRVGRFVEGKSPGIAAAFSVHDMPVSHVKQLWPWFSARKARQWVLENLFGGRVVDARLQYQVEPGRHGQRRAAFGARRCSAPSRSRGRGSTPPD